ncbi:MAG: hypothetical protein KAR05_10175 [Candidatus Omnitrophica bacterium]|nr:hypothetical protein [Candidatus Omnitrophota bacterium]
MKSQRLTIRIKDVPVYEHLDESLKRTPAERLAWLDKARKFVRTIKSSKRKQ